jgi:hypothetical protein
LLHVQGAALGIGALGDYQWLSLSSFDSAAPLGTATVLIIVTSKSDESVFIGHSCHRMLLRQNDTACLGTVGIDTPIDGA